MDYLTRRRRWLPLVLIPAVVTVLYIYMKSDLNHMHPFVPTGQGKSTILKTRNAFIVGEVKTKAKHSNYSWDFRTQPILPRSAFLNENLKFRHCDNLTVIFVAIEKTALQDHAVTGCESEGRTTRNFTKTEVFVQYGYVHKRRPLLTHDGATVTCCNLPVQNGSIVFILYKNKTGGERKVKTERELYIPPPGRPHLLDDGSQQKPSVVVCVTVYGKPPWLSEWLVYQKTIGVDHIYLYAQESFIDEGSANNTILRQYLVTNYATLDVWPTYLNNSQIYYYQQILLYQDCIHRLRKTFDYALLYDTDDFFVPVVSGKTDIHYYIHQFFSSTIGSISFLWSLHHPDCGLTQNPSTFTDGNVTKYLVNKEMDKRYKYIKSIHKLSVVNEIGIHEAVKLVPKYKSKQVPTSWAYIAHLRTGTLKKHPHVCDGINKTEPL